MPGSGRSRAAIAVFVGVALSAPGIVASAELSVTGRVAETLTADSNLSLTPDNDEPAFGSTTNLTLNVDATGDRWSGSLGTAANFRAFTEDNSGGDSSRNGIAPQLFGRARFDVSDRLSTSANLRFRRTSTEFTRFGDDLSLDPEIELDPVLQDENATLTNLSFGAGATYRASPLDRFSANLGANLARYSENSPTLSDSQGYNLSIDWARTITPLSTMGVTISGRQNMIEDEPERDTQTLTATVNFGTSLSPRLTLNVRTGLSYTQTDVDADNVAMMGARSETNMGFSGSLDFRYTGARTTLGARIAQETRPTSDGVTRNVTSLRANLDRKLTPLLSVAVLAQYSRQSTLASDIGGSAGTQQLFLVSPTISYALTENWDASLGYRTRFRINDDDTAISNSVFLTLSRGFELY
jgi:hypothetical protein